MITFILIFAGLVVAVAAYFIATGANQRKRAGQSSQSVAQSEQEGAGKPAVGRANGMN